MKRICVVTATRAEYGVLKRVIKAIQMDEELELYLIVTGTHLMEKYGHTIDEILEDGFSINEEIYIEHQGETSCEISKTMSRYMDKFSECFERVAPDMLVVLGDRYELLSICSCAMNEGIPIAHISGGEVTEGAIDDVIRHCITKMSYLHFVGCEEYRRRVIQLGEDPDRVFNFGDVGVENVLKTRLMSKAELEQSLQMSLDQPYGVVTFHPVTTQVSESISQAKELMDAISDTKDMQFIVTGANADVTGDKINMLWKEFSNGLENVKYFDSLGALRYLSAVKYAEIVMGNSSSGIIEAPALKVQTINIGDRQRGRLKADSIIDVEPKKANIVQAIKCARSEENKKKTMEVKSLYGEGNTAIQIVDKIKEYVYSDCQFVKKFYDIEFS